MERIFTPLGDTAFEPLELGTSIETTRPQGQKGFGRIESELTATGHHREFRQDFKRISKVKIKNLGASLDWNRIQKRPDLRRRHWDWSWHDEYMQAANDMGFNVTMRILQHTGGPGNVPIGDPSMPDRAAEMSMEVLARYPNIKGVNIENEAWTNEQYGYLFNAWHPHVSDDRQFAQAIINVAKTICHATETIKSSGKYPDLRHIYNDPCESHRVATAPYEPGPDSEGFARFKNEMRTLTLDLCLGLVTQTHPLLWFLRKNGITDNELAWFQDHAVRFDQLNLHYYDSHEHCYFKDGGDLAKHRDNLPRGLFDTVMKDYYPKYGRIIPRFAIGEINLFASDPIKWTWLLTNWADCVRLRAAGCPVVELVWHGFFGGRHWNTELRRPSNEFCHFGVAWLERHPRIPRKITRHTGLFYDKFRELASGNLSLKGQVAYLPDGLMADRLRGYVRGPWCQYRDLFDWQPVPKDYRDLR